VAWAAVGHLPDPQICPPERQVCLADVPLQGCPPWLGVDRALAGWGAWEDVGDSVLVVDAGTVMTLTRVDAGGTFRGGRLQAGLRLQLEAMAAGTALLPNLADSPPPSSTAGETDADDPDWPRGTAGAMRVGVATGLAAAVIEAAKVAGSRWVVLTGGDCQVVHPLIAPAVALLGLSIACRPLLCLESLARLRPEP
jgi:type III pantothenate kinase